MMYDEKIVTVLQSAFRNAVIDLREKHHERFYFYVFVSDAPLCPYVSACSYEAYERSLVNDEIAEEDKAWWKWDYCDSEYCVYGYDEFFGNVKKMLAERAEGMDDDELYGNEWKTRIASMEEALRRLDSEGFFGTGEERKRVIINAEIVPPSYEERQRVIRLNPQSDLLSEYLEFCEDEE